MLSIPETAPSSKLDNAPTDATLETIKNAVDDASYIQQGGALILLLIPFLIAVAAAVAFRVIVFLRFLEIYILTAFAPLPVAFVGNSETKSIAIGYLKRYGAVVLQGALLVLVITMYSYAATELGDLNVNNLQGGSIFPWIITNYVVLLAAPAAFLVVIFASQRMAKAILGK